MLVDRKVKFYLHEYLILKNGFIIFHLLSLCLYTSVVIIIIVSDRVEENRENYRNPGSHVFHLLITVGTVFALLPARVPGSYLFVCFINPVIVISSFFVRLVFLRNDFRYGNDYRNPGSHVSHLLSMPSFYLFRLILAFQKSCEPFSRFPAVFFPFYFPSFIMSSTLSRASRTAVRTARTIFT